MKFICISIFSVLFFVGCAKDDSKQNTSELPIATNNLAANTCVVTRPDGMLEGGFAGSTVFLSKKYLSSAIQKIYHDGVFPSQYSMGNPEKAPAREILLKTGTSWKWSIEPAKDSEGKRTLLRIYKEILNPVDNDSYELDSKVFHYGDQIQIIDSDSNIRIECSIPKDT